MSLSSTLYNPQEQGDQSVFCPQYFQYYTQNPGNWASNIQDTSPQDQVDYQFRWVHTISGIQRTTKEKLLITLGSYPYSSSLDHTILKTARDLFPALESLFELTEILAGTDRQDITKIEHLVSIYLYCAIRGDFSIWNSTMDNWDTLLFLEEKYIPPSRKEDTTAFGPYDIRKAKSSLLSSDFFRIVGVVGRTLFEVHHFTDFEPFIPFPQNTTSPSLIQKILGKTQGPVSPRIFYEKIVPLLVSHQDIPKISPKDVVLQDITTGHFLDTDEIAKSQLYSIVHILSGFGGRTHNPKVLPYLACEALFENPNFMATFDNDASWQNTSNVNIDADLQVFREMIFLGVRLIQGTQLIHKEYTPLGGIHLRGRGQGNFMSNIAPSQFKNLLELLKKMESYPESVYFTPFYIQLAILFCQMPHSAWALSVNAAQNSENSSEKRHAQTSIAERDRFTAYLLKKVGLTKKEILKIVDEIPDMTDTSTPLPALIPSAS